MSTESRSPTVTLSVVHDTITEQCFAMVLDIYRLTKPPTRLQTFLILVQNRRLSEQPRGVVEKVFCIGNEAVTLTAVWKPQHKNKQLYISKL